MNGLAGRQFPNVNANLVKTLKHPHLYRQTNKCRIVMEKKASQKWENVARVNAKRDKLLKKLLKIIRKKSALNVITKGFNSIVNQQS